MRIDALRELFENHIENTPPKGIVADKSIKLCRLSKEASDALECEPFPRIHINARVLKHMYDSKPAEEFDFLLDHLHTIAKYPDSIYRNKKGKRGIFCLTKALKHNNYFCSLELKKDGEGKKEFQIVTAFRVRDDKYLRDYDLLWSWRADIPSS